MLWLYAFERILKTSLCAFGSGMIKASGGPPEVAASKFCVTCVPSLYLPRK